MKRPTLADLRDSGSIEQDADTMIFLFREAYYLKDPISNNQAEEDKRIGRLMQVAARAGGKHRKTTVRPRRHSQTVLQYWRQRHSRR